MSFQAFPSELLTEVFGLLRSSRDLANLSLCCRRFYDISPPFLYNSYTQCSNDGMAALVRTILEKPSLAKYVKHFTAFHTGIEDENLTSKTAMSLMTGENCSYLRRTYLSDVQLGPIFVEENNYLDALKLGDWEAFTALQIKIFSDSLESIAFPEHYGSSENSYIKDVLERAGELQKKSATSGCLSNLRKVAVRWHGHEPGLNLENVLPLLKLESVTQFEGDMMLVALHPRSRFPIPNLSLNTTDVSLTNSSIHPHAMIGFLQSFHSLRRFKYEHGWSHTVPTFGTNFGEGLAHLTQCLEELIVTCVDGKWGKYIVEDETIGSLARFKELRTIKMTAYLLLGLPKKQYGKPYYTEKQARNFVGALPMSLEHLDIEDCEADMENCADFLFTRGDPPPHLKTLQLVGSEYAHLADWWEEEALKKGVVLTRRSEKEIEPDWRADYLTPRRRHDRAS